MYDLHFFTEIIQEKLVTIGVPQGSTLGPVHFLLYINDKVQYVNNGSCNLFADDYMCYTTGNTVEEVRDVLQLDLDEVDAWYRRNNCQ